MTCLHESVLLRSGVIPCIPLRVYPVAKSTDRAPDGRALGVVGTRAKARLLGGEVSDSGTMRARRSPEEKAARRRAAWDRKVAETAARAAAREAEREAVVKVQKRLRKSAEEARAADVAAKADRLSAKGRPLRFPALGIAVLDDAVYVTARSGPCPLGPLSRASASFQMLSPRLVTRDSSELFIAEWFGTKAEKIKKVPRASVSVNAGGKVHASTLEGLLLRQASAQVERFNILASRARLGPGAPT
jgi:hypothetical protein